VYSEASYIAMFIGAALQHPLPVCNGFDPIMSTIKVHQYKTKFDQVRVYCQLAEPTLIQKSWIEDSGKPARDFSIRAYIRDGKIYRSTYLSMKQLAANLPGFDYQSQVLDCADYPHLLFETFDDFKVWLEKDDFENIGERIDVTPVITRSEYWKIFEKIYSI